MNTVYNILFCISFVLASPYYLWRMVRRGNWQSGFSQRLAKYSSDLKQALTNRHVLWLHAVSVGEVNLCLQLIHALEPRLPNIKIVVSTTTSTGMAELRKRLPQRISKIYYPIDRRKYVSRAIATINPEAIVLVEAEIWPNFLQRLHRLNIPTFLVNARMSDRSFPRYKRFGVIFRPLFSYFAWVGSQNEQDTRRLIEIGCKPDSVETVGNLKFDVPLSHGSSLNVAEMLQRLGVPSDALILVAGSTHSGEEAMIADIFLRLRERHPKLFLILVPRHAERSRDVARKLRERKLPFVFRDEITEATRHAEGTVNCLLVNTTGELMRFYRVADVVFVGKSVLAVGGQNPIEPAALGKAVVMGPNMQNFTDIVRIFLQRQAVVQVSHQRELEKAIDDLLSDDNRRAQLGRNAQAVVAENAGAVSRTVEAILDRLRPRGIYVADKK